MNVKCIRIHDDKNENKKEVEHFEENNTMIKFFHKEYSLFMEVNQERK